MTKILGRGGMGVVWLARDGELERDVALKFLPEVVAMDQQSLYELKRETRRSLELTHPHIVRIYDFVQDSRTAAISMEYVAGDTLAARKLAQPNHCFSPEELGEWLEQLAGALDYAHQKAQVVHRDLKPANLMIDARGDLKIADFGIAASVSDSVSRVSQQAGSSGTPVYMSPQQMMGEKPAVADDVYALGATLYDLLTGKPPFHSGNIMMQVLNKTAPDLNERRQAAGAKPVPAAWAQTIAACLAKEPAERPSGIGELVKRLRGASDQPGRSPAAPSGVAGDGQSSSPPSKSMPATIQAEPVAATSLPPGPSLRQSIFAVLGVAGAMAITCFLVQGPHGIFIVASLAALGLFAIQNVCAWPMKLVLPAYLVWVFMTRADDARELVIAATTCLLLLFGFVTWLRGPRAGSRSHLPVTGFGMGWRVLLLSMVGLMAALLSLKLYGIGRDGYLPDSIWHGAAVFAWLGLGLAVWKKIECWPVWLIGETLGFFMQARAQSNLAIPGTIFCLVCAIIIWGWRQWHLAMDADGNLKSMAVSSGSPLNTAERIRLRVLALLVALLPAAFSGVLFGSFVVYFADWPLSDNMTGVIVLCILASWMPLSWVASQWLRRKPRLQA
ncbi:MAG TPA: protein kinase [Opitutaceae bacterium]|nr:protein kinase [Opitutaceae bacterium]HRJ48811.1 protein kinase [Opitutaceae bacterium]